MAAAPAAPGPLASRPAPELSLPEPDWALSPLTGFTREHWLAIADHWLDHITRFSSGDPARPHLPGRVTWAGVAREGMETIARSFLGVVARYRARQDEASKRVVRRYISAIVSGTTPGGPGAWPLGVTCRTPLVGVTQSIVEAAHIAFALYIGKNTVWPLFSPEEQEQVAAWLLHHGQLDVWDNNWQLFPAMCEGFLRSIGKPTPGCHGKRHVARVESWYLGEGWYTDGKNNAVDYYNAWTIHPFLWAWYAMTDQRACHAARRHDERLARFVSAWARLVADDGSLVHIGRSLTYRTAALAALWCAELAGVNPLSAGRTRTLASRVLRNFINHGVGDSSPLSLGWYGDCEAMSQSYSGYGSSYLAMFGFLGLSLPADAGVWTAVEEEATATIEARYGQPVSWPSVGWHVTRSESGLVRVANHGSDHVGLPVEPGADPDDPHYAKLGYSSHTGPGLAQAWDDAIDSHIALVDGTGRASRRCAIRAFRAEEGVVASVHLPQLDGKALPGAAISTYSFSHGDLELRIHRVATAAGFRVREGGYALADMAPPTSFTLAGGRAVRTQSGLTTAIVPLAHWTSAGLARYEDANAFGRHSAVPYLESEISAGITTFASLHLLTLNAHSPAGQILADSGPKNLVRIEFEHDRVRVTWPQTTTCEVDLARFLPWDHAVASPPVGH